MSLEKRNALAPQMREYDRIGDCWVPYLMRIDTPEFSGPVATTNQFGIRYTRDKSGQHICMPTAEEVGTFSVGIVLGGSTVFGVGATTNAETLPSHLNKISETSWFNYGGRVFSSTQEQIRLGLLLPEKLDSLLIFSGVNNLTLAYLASTTSPVYNSFFYQSIYENSMKNPAGAYIGVRQAVKRLFSELVHRFGSKTSPVQRQSVRQSYSDILTCFRRDLRVVNKIAQGFGAKTYFAMQPLATWIDRKLSPEEEQIFPELDAMNAFGWEILSRHMNEMRDEYFVDMRRICSEEGVPFVNLNLAPEFREPGWLFVDRVHLTDLGHKRAAAALKREFGI